MKKLALLLAFPLLTACESGLVGDITAQFQQLNVNEFCKLRDSDLNTAQKRYLDKEYTFSGTIIDFDQNGIESVIGIQDSSGAVWVKVYNHFKGQKVGDVVKIRGIISDANFDHRSGSECKILMDNGMLID